MALELLYTDQKILIIKIESLIFVRTRLILKLTYKERVTVGSSSTL